MNGGSSRTFGRRGGRRARCAALVILGATLAGCATVPDTGRRTFYLMSPQEEARLGLTEFEKYKRQKPISRDAELNARLQRVGSRMSRAFNLPGTQWEFVVFDDPQPNAFALPGGKVGVHSGIFPITKNDAGLAAVVGHEVAHVIARHGAERISRQMVAAGLGTALGVVLAQNDSMGSAERAAVLGAYGVGATVGVILPFSREQELEADELGTLYMARAGYDPREALAFWRRFAAHKESGGKMPEFLSTHPLDSTRIRRLEEFMPRAIAEYEAATGRGAEGTGSPLPAPTPLPAPPGSSSAPRALPFQPR